MSTRFKSSMFRLRTAALVAGFAALSSVATAQAQTATEEEIVQALTPKPLTRSLSGAPMAASPTASADAAFLDSVRSRPITSLTADERTKLASVTSKNPSIDLAIPFAYRSAQVGPQALPEIKALGAALANRDLKGGTFLIAGHTDGKGSEVMNQRLSERRAEAVKQYLVRNYGIPAPNLISVGYGKSRLKVPSDPFADANRRVEVTNISEVKSSSR